MRFLLACVVVGAGCRPVFAAPPQAELIEVRKIWDRAPHNAFTDLVRFHDGSLPELPRRGYVITADDGFLDCVEPFLDHAAVHPQLFVPTTEVGGRSWWAGDEPLAGWSDLRRLADAGIGVGSHGQRHVALPELDDARLGEELTASRQDLERELPATIPVLAYPHGRRDPRVT